jgi:hypothetical protein
MSTRLLRAAVWGTEHGGLNRVAACLSDDPELEATLLVTFTRLVLVGADGVRLHEEVFPAGGWLRDGRFLALGVTKLGELVDRVLAIENPESASPLEQQGLARQWQRGRAALATAMANRAREREQSVRTRLDTLKADEVKRLDQALDQFRRTLERALGSSEAEQLELRLDDLEERSQLRRDVDAWRTTLAGLDAQREAEAQQIDHRYSEVRALTFPAAILFVVPRRSQR